MKLFGYIRTTIIDADPQSQVNQLTAYGCTAFFQEDYLEAQPFPLERALEQMQAGDVLVVDQLYRLGRSTRQLADLLVLFQEKQIDLVCLTEKIDTRELTGKIYFQWLEQMAVMERSLLKERTLVGLNKARQQGKIGGRPKIAPATIQQIRFLFFEKRESIQAIATICGVSIGTCYKYVHLPEHEVELLQK